MRLMLLALTICLATSLLMAWMYRPRDAGPDVPSGKLRSVSFAPFREGENPLQKRFPSVEDVEADLRFLAQQTHSIRTYSATEIFSEVPRLARRYGLRVTHGAWLGYNDTDNQQEINQLIAAAKTYPDVISRVIVGNEVLLRGEMDAARLLDYIRQVKQAIQQPVSYADVWSFYLRYPEILDAVDYVTIHILPYWEDEPISAEDAPKHIARVYREVRAFVDARYPGKPILIGETGWPSMGRQRGRAVPSVVNAARFIRQWVHIAETQGVDYNIVEAFDQPWKSALEGVVGAHWGLYTAERRLVYPLTGPVTEHPDWPVSLAAMLGLFVLGVLIHRQSLAHLPLGALCGALLCLQILAVVWVSLAQQTWQFSTTTLQRGRAVLLIGFYGLFLLTSTRLIMAWLSQRALSVPWRRAWLSMGYCLGALVIGQSLALAINGRYLNIPLPWVYGLLIALVGVAWARYHTQRDWHCAISQLAGQALWRTQHDRSWGWLLLSAALLTWFGEMQAFWWARDLIAAHPILSERSYWALWHTFSNRQLDAWVIGVGSSAVFYLTRSRHQTTENPA